MRFLNVAMRFLNVAMSSYGKQQLGARGASTAPLAILPSALGLGGIIVN